MKISTNCSPLVIYFGFFFPDKTITLRRGRGRMGWGGSGGGKLGSDLRTKYMERGGRGQTWEQKCVSVIEEHSVWGASRTRTPSLQREKVDLFAEALSRFIRPPETAFESVYCETHSSNLDKILTVY